MNHLREFAERYISDFDNGFIPDVAEECARDVCVAYRDLCDDTPLDEAWLRSICDPIHDDGLAILDDFLHVAIHFVASESPNVWGARIGRHDWPHDLHTRGCVRRLCLACYIDLSANH